MIRSHVNWHEQGEKNNIYFLNLENFKKERSVIRNLNINGTDDFTTDPKIIMKEIQEFYSNLYSERKLDEEAAAAFLNKVDIPKINEDLKLSCEGLLTVNETYNILITFADNKTPGNDGLPAEFYKWFWPLLGKQLTQCLNYSFEYSQLSSSQSQAVITLIQKKDRDKRFVKNWRPISLMNVDAKIGSKSITHYYSLGSMCIC